MNHEEEESEQNQARYEEAFRRKKTKKTKFSKSSSTAPPPRLETAPGLGMARRLVLWTSPLPWGLTLLDSPQMPSESIFYERCLVWWRNKVTKVQGPITTGSFC